MGRKFVVSALSVMVVLTAFVSGIYMAVGSNGFPVDDNADVYAVVGDKKIPLSGKDSRDVKKMLKAKYSRDQSGKCPFDHNIGFEIGNYRYAVAMDGCNTVDVYLPDGSFVCSGGNFWGEEYVSEYFYKYVDREDILEYFYDT